MRRSVIAAVLLAATAMLAVPATAGHGPELIRLPDGFQPEGIAAAGHETPGHKARGHMTRGDETRGGKTIFVGSIPTGAVWRGDVRTGVGDVLVPAHEGRNAIGLKADRHGRLFVAGGASGGLYVYDAHSGADVAAFPVGGGFVNDVALAKRAAYFTDSRKAALYVLPFDRDGLGTPSTLALTGDFQLGEGNNLNGIVVAGHGTLIAVQSNTGELHRIDATTGETHRIDLGGATLTNGDGLLLRGRTLLVVRNRLNQIAVVKLAGDLGSGEVVGTITDPDFDVPTTIAKVGRSLYAVNARFGTPEPATARYDVVRVGELRAAGRRCERRHRWRGATVSASRSCRRSSPLAR